jgi:hypothetical protein
VSSQQVYNKYREKQAVVEKGKEKKAVAFIDEKAGKIPPGKGNGLEDVHEDSPCKNTFLVALQNKTGEEGKKA